MRSGGRGARVSMSPRPDLAGLLADPGCAAEIPAEAAPALLALVAAELARLAAVQAALAARLATTGKPAADEDGLVTADEAAVQLGTTKDWLRRHPALPFRVELSPGQVRYSRRGIARFIAARAGRR